MEKTKEGTIIQRQGMLRSGLLDFISSLSLNDMFMIEVGSYAGESSDIFASSGKVRELVCIDPWKTGYDENDVASSSNMKAAEDAFDKVAEKHSSIIRKFKGTLEDYIAENPNSIPDLIYIDACHTY